MRFKEAAKKHQKSIRGIVLFILGAIVTLLITSIWNDKIWPTSPIYIERMDSIKVVHEYPMPIESDSLTELLAKQLQNLELLNKYETEVNARVRKINNTDNNNIIPNLIALHYQEYLRKGYTLSSSSPYFTLNTPDLENEYIDFKPNFFNPEISNEIAFLRLNIFRISDNDSQSRSYIMNDVFEVKPYNNLVRIDNNLSKGKYEINFGFIFKKDLEKEYHTFYQKRFFLSKL